MSGTSLVPYEPKKKITGGPTIDKLNEIIPPLDYSFCHLDSFSTAKDEEPRLPVTPRGKGKQQQQQQQQQQQNDENEDAEAVKSSGRCLKMNNNNITNLECLVQFAEVKFTNWQNIAWIDLSQNELTKIGPELTEFVSLQILYLHGNQINDPGQVDQLIPLKYLRKLTLHGNPMETVKGYRWLVLSKLPQLQSLDFSSITKADKKTSGTWEKMNSWGQRKKKKIEDDED